MPSKIAEIKQILKESANDEGSLLKFVEEYNDDARKGVVALVKSATEKLAAVKAEKLRTEALWAFENECYAKGFSVVAGADEVGRGPLAGPVVAAAVVLPRNCEIYGVNDSKKLTEKKREELFDIINKKAVAVSYGMASPQRIDEINILNATMEAMRKALEGINPPPDYVLVDGNRLPDFNAKKRYIIGGDGLSISIGAASIMAKVTRDRLMKELDGAYPQYGFAKNKGYGSKEHIDAIIKYGPCPIHRRSFLQNILSVGEKKSADRRLKGAYGEKLAAKQMEKMGYEIIDKNYRGQAGEIDIIAKKDGVLIFAEVKLRKSSDMGYPAEAVDERKQKRIAETAEQYMAEKGLESEARFDVAEILYQDGKQYFRYTENAFIL